MEVLTVVTYLAIQPPAVSLEATDDLSDFHFRSGRDSSKGSAQRGGRLTVSRRKDVA